MGLPSVRLGRLLALLRRYALGGPYYGTYDNSYLPNYASYYYSPDYDGSYVSSYPDAAASDPPDVAPAQTATVAPTSPGTGLVVAGNQAHIRVVLPANAELWFDGQKTAATGIVRDFSTPPITPGQDYSYQVRARWTDDGHQVERTRNIDFRAGQEVVVDLTSGFGTSAGNPTTAGHR